MSELVIRGGTVVDGTGRPGHRADVSIDGGRISAVGKGLDGERVLDAGGHVVAPGFIDIHTHYDAQVFWDPSLTPSCFHGVTTVVAGNCGFSIAPTRTEHRSLIAHTLENVEDMDVSALEAGIPWDFSTFPEYLASVERHGLGLNFAAYLGHTALRLFVMGDDAYERAASPDEIDRMQAVLRRRAGGRRRRIRHQLLPHPLRGRREEDPEPVRRTARARGPARYLGLGRPGCGRLRTRRRRHRRPLRPSTRHRGPVHLRSPPHVPYRIPPSPARGESVGLGSRGRGLAPSLPPSFVLHHEDDRAVHAQRQPDLRRADRCAGGGPGSGLRRSGVAPKGARCLGREHTHAASVGHLRVRRVRPPPRDRRAPLARHRRRTRCRPSRCPPRLRVRRARASYRQLLGQRRHRRGGQTADPRARHLGSLRCRRPRRPAL